MRLVAARAVRRLEAAAKSLKRCTTTTPQHKNKGISCHTLLNDDRAKRGNKEQTKNLPMINYLSVGSKVMLTSNVCLPFKLANGTIGTVVDIIFAVGTAPPNLPLTIIVDFLDYCGPPFFVGNGREKWVPILNETATWYPGQRITLTRTQQPLNLCWSITPWKAQGSSYHTPCQLNFGDNERTAGTAYVVDTRVTTIDHIYCPNPPTFQRFTEEITKKPGFKFRQIEESRLKHLSSITLLRYNEHMTSIVDMCVCGCGLSVPQTSISFCSSCLQRLFKPSCFASDSEMCHQCFKNQP